MNVAVKNKASRLRANREGFDGQTVAEKSILPCLQKSQSRRTLTRLRIQLEFDGNQAEELDRISENFAKALILRAECPQL
jgi:hypothetical protein